MNAMDKRLKEHIDKLLRLYDEARTTDEQERELADFFSQPHDTLPEEWERYAALFTAFAGSESLFSEAELEAMAAPRTSRRFWPWLMGAAATVALLVGFALHYPQKAPKTDTTFVEITIHENPIEEFFIGVSKLKSELELRIEQDKYLTFVDRMLYGRKAGCVGNGNRNRIPIGYKSGDTLQTIPTNFIQAGMTNKGAIDWGYLPLSFGRRDANQIWTHRRSGYDWTMTPYHKYQETLLKKLGISISFPESAVRYFSHNGVMEDWAIFTAGMSDASNIAAIFDGRMFVQISPDFCVVLENIERDTGKHVFRNRIDMVRERKLSVDTYNSTSFEGLIRSNCDVPWIGWFDYSGEDLRKLEEWNGADYITRFKESAWVKNSHAEIGFIVRFPNFKKILYNFNALGDTNVGSSYNACYGIELFRLYNPRSINMLFFINTEKEKDILKCVEEVCRYVSFDNSHIGHETKRKEKIKVPDSLSVK